MHYFQKFIDIIATLRGPDGCPWDKEQTAESLRGDLLEEAYECVDAINSGNNEHIKEELGDLFLLAAMISYIKEQGESFTLESVVEGVSDKLVRRHPHVFEKSEILNSEEVIRQWEEIKRDVEGKVDENSVLNTVPRSLPPLERSYKYQKKAAKVGFDWKARSDVLSKVREEIAEIEALGDDPDHQAAEEEIGDLLFAVVNLSRHYRIDPAVALHGANSKFFRRFNYIERKIAEAKKKMCDDEFALMDAFWDEAKSKEK